MEIDLVELGIPEGWPVVDVQGDAEVASDARCKTIAARTEFESRDRFMGVTKLLCLEEC